MTNQGASAGGNPIVRLITASTKIERHELVAALASFLFVFVLMAAYFILRPVRDALSSNWSNVELSQLWTMTFFLSLIAVSVYGAVMSRLPFRFLVPGVYAFFAFSFFAFYFGSTQVADPVLVDKSFYVWLSVFSLFNLSVFWSFMSDIFNKRQAPRLFGFIATGVSAGAWVGSAIAGSLVKLIGAEQLMLVSAVMLLLPIPLIHFLERLKTTSLGNPEDSATFDREQPLGRNPLKGFSLFFQSRYLLGIGLFILLYVAIGAYVYFGLKELMTGMPEDSRVQVWALIDFSVNTLTILIAIFITGRISIRFGMPTLLALIPALICLGMLVVAMAPVLAVVVGLQIARRVGNYAITRPGREMLFTLVDRETRYKAKPVIDIVLYRGGDMIWAWSFALLTEGPIFVGLGGVAVIGALIAAVWAMTGFWLGRNYERRADDAVVQQDPRTGETAPG